jgi:hypothetical protein
MGNILFEEKYDEEMSYIQMREAYLFYNIKIKFVLKFIQNVVAH